MWVQVATLDELDVGDQKSVTVNSRRLLVCRTNAGIYVIDNQCPHAGFPLKGGDLIGTDAIRCPVHGAVFCLSDGKNLDGGLLDSVQTYPVKLGNELIKVKLD